MNDTKQKCQEILLNILERCNMQNSNDYMAGIPVISFNKDWGGNTLTISTPETHFHVGNIDESFADLVDDMHKVLCGE